MNNVDTQSIVVICTGPIQFIGHLTEELAQDMTANPNNAVRLRQAGMIGITTGMTQSGISKRTMIIPIGYSDGPQDLVITSKDYYYFPSKDLTAEASTKLIADYVNFLQGITPQASMISQPVMVPR